MTTEFDWTSASTETLLNPRLPGSERRELLEIYAAMPTLPGHVWLTTSGSSGLKWVALSKQALLISAEAVNTHLEASSADTWALALPEFHVGGLGILARSWLSGARVCRFNQPRWDATVFHEFLGETGTTLASLVPAQLHDLVQGSLVSPPALRAVVVGGGALNPALHAEARRLGWPVLASYGLSECCSQVATAALSSLETGTTQEDFPLLSHVAARTNSITGQISLQSGALLSGYGLPAEYPGGAARFVDPKQEGWFETEDRGVVNDARLTLLGRAGDFIKIGGESVEMPRLDRLLELARASEPGSPDIALLAAADTRLGAVIHLVAAGEPSEAQEAAVARIIAHYKAQALPFERIREVHWVSAIPRSPLGKMLRKTVMEMLGLRTP